MGIVLPDPVHQELILMLSLTQSQQYREERLALIGAYHGHLLLPQPPVPVPHYKHLIRHSFERSRNPIEVDSFSRTFALMVTPTLGTVIKVLHLNLYLLLSNYDHHYPTTPPCYPSGFFNFSPFRILMTNYPLPPASKLQKDEEINIVWSAEL